MIVSEPVLRCCRISPTITAKGVISIRSRLTPLPYVLSLLLAQCGMKRAPIERVSQYVRHIENFQNAASANAVPCCRVMTMRLMMKFVFVLLALSAFSISAVAQEPAADDSYEFILAKLAADEGRFDDALSR